ncbi:MAG TPA: CoA ester lyase [Burkholderiaceae bacterium]|jgi:citrate lyase subunit beta/citryl-CoA lyase|nr:CoA ester lyase [Burkholderiaceae bacterium]
MSTSPRSYLFVPGNRPERFDKALAAGADAVIVDLEDAVPEADKDRAREQVRAWLDASRPVVLRINGLQTTWFREDAVLCEHPGVAAVMLPKTECAEDTRPLRGKPVLALIETAVGFAAARSIALAPSVRRLVFGSIDFQLDLDMATTNEELLAFRSELALASRLAHIERPVDGVCTALDDEEELRSQGLHARRLGFGAKLCIHPRQVGAVNECFSPSQERIEWARRVLSAARAAGSAAVALDGRMIDRPVILQAEQVLREARLDD